MNCLHCNKHIYNYYDGEISPQLKLQIDNHLAACSSCRFQYDLTLMENKVLRDTSDIPEISSDFNKRVMEFITPKQLPNLPDNVLVISKDKRLHFKWSSVYTKSAVAVLLLVLCFYVPGILTDGHEQKIAQDNNSAQLELNLPKEKVARVGGIAMQDSQTISAQDKEKSLSAMQWSGQDGNQDLQTHTPQPKLDTTNPQLYAGSRMVLCESGRSQRKEINSDTLSVSSLILKNIPDKYKLVNKVNSLDNQIEYSYRTDDGSEIIDIYLITSPTQAQAISPELSNEKVSKPLMNLAAPAAVAEIVNREIQVGDQKISVQVSGNISSDELNHLANNIDICKNP